MALDGRQRINGMSSGESCGIQQTTTMSPNSNNNENVAESMEMEKRSRDRALSICRIYTRETVRYSLLKHLNNVGKNFLSFSFASFYKRCMHKFIYTAYSFVYKFFFFFFSICMMRLMPVTWYTIPTLVAVLQSFEDFL